MIQKNWAKTFLIQKEFQVSKDFLEKIIVGPKIIWGQKKDGKNHCSKKYG